MNNIENIINYGFMALFMVVLFAFMILCSTVAGTMAVIVVSSMCALTGTGMLYGFIIEYKDYRKSR